MPLRLIGGCVSVIGAFVLTHAIRLRRRDEAALRMRGVKEPLPLDLPSRWSVQNWLLVLLLGLAIVAMSFL